MDQTSLRRTQRLKSLAIDLGVLAGLLLLYGLIYARGFLSHRYLFPLDNSFLWSLRAELLYSIRAFHSLPWWDPTMCNGTPLYPLFQSYFPYLSLFHLPSLVGFKLLDLLVGVSLNTYIAFEHTIYIFSFNVLAIYLISREIIEERIAAVLPPFIFAFSYFQILGLGNSYALEAMIAPLFYLYGLIRYCRRRTALDLCWLAFFTATLFGSLSMMHLESAVFWATSVTLALLIFERGLFSDTYILLRGLLSTRLGRVAAAIGALLMISGLALSISTVYYNLGHLLRYRKDLPFSYDDVNILSNNLLKVETSEAWTILFNWVPFPELHDKFLPFAWAGHDYRYIGMATIPLVLAAFLLGTAGTYQYAFALTYFLCNAFLIYTTKNLIYQIGLDHSSVLRNVRDTLTLLPRSGPPMFLIFLAGMGLDNILRNIQDKDLHAIKQAPCPKQIFLGQALKTLFFAGFIFLAGAPILAIWQAPLVHTAVHVGLYLAVFSFLCWQILRTSDKRMKSRICIVFFVFVFTDLIISASFNIDRDRGFVARTPIDSFPKEARIPDDISLKPSQSESTDLFPAAYAGFHHDVGIAIKEWLALYTNPIGRPLLKNWNFNTSIEKQYPVFEFYSNGRYAPFDAIRNLGASAALLEKQPPFLLHDAELVSRTGVAPAKTNGEYQILKFAFNSVQLKTTTSQNGFLYYLDNYDRFWTAYVDGDRVPIQRANFTFKAIELPAGTHLVSWIYDPFPTRMALYFHCSLAILTLLFMLFWESGAAFALKDSVFRP